MEQGQLEDDAQKSASGRKKLMGGLVVAGGLGLTAYAFRDRIKQFINWEQSIEQDSQNSADMLTGKLNLAQHLVGAKDVEGARASLVRAKAEARKLLKLNREFEKRLAKFSAMPDRPGAP